MRYNIKIKSHGIRWIKNNKYSPMPHCPECNSSDIVYNISKKNKLYTAHCQCKNCRCLFTITRREE